eukprot:scaffold5705_cov140-Skeletonema_dohrnii-CCMP3373.AAC.2
MTKLIQLSQSSPYRWGRVSLLAHYGSQCPRTHFLHAIPSCRLIAHLTNFMSVRALNACRHNSELSEFLRCSSSFFFFVPLVCPAAAAAPEEQRGEQLPSPTQAPDCIICWLLCQVPGGVWLS